MSPITTNAATANAAAARALSALIPPMRGPSGGFTQAVTRPVTAVTGGISPRHPANADGKGDTPDGIGG